MSNEDILEESLELFVSMLRQIDREEHSLVSKIDILKDDLYALELRRREIYKDMQELEEFLAHKSGGE